MRRPGCYRRRRALQHGLVFVDRGTRALDPGVDVRPRVADVRSQADDPVAEQQP